MSTATNGLCSLLLALLLTGCSPLRGLIYSHTTVPYSSTFRETPVGTKHCLIRSHQIREPLSGRSIYAEWSTDLILGEARKAGIKEIYSMDKRTLSILLGIYKRETLLVYGD